MATLDPLTHLARPGIEPVSSWILVRFLSAEPHGNSSKILILIGLSSKITSYPYKRKYHMRTETHRENVRQGLMATLEPRRDKERVYPKSQEEPTLLTPWFSSSPEL